MKSSRKGRSLLEAGYIYAPYIPLQVIPIVTIPPKDLALVKCHHCNKKLENNDEVFSITARRFSSYDLDFVTLKNAQIDGAFSIAVPREVNFHKGCFLEVAGTEYAP